MHKFEKSSSISHCRHENGCLYIKFHSSNKEHEFKDVPAEIYEGMKAAESPGKYFHQNIRKQYKSS